MAFGGNRISFVRELYNTSFDSARFVLQTAYLDSALRLGYFRFADVKSESHPQLSVGYLGIISVVAYLASRRFSLRNEDCGSKELDTFRWFPSSALGVH